MFPPLILHDQQTLLAQSILAIASGDEDLHDHETLRNDPALQRATGQLPDRPVPLASPPTLYRPGNRADRPSVVRMAEVLVDQFLAAHPRP